MNDPSWRPSYRRPRSASGAVIDPGSYSKQSSTGSRPSSRQQSASHGKTSSPELDFTDKLKALRELIASSKSHGHEKENREKVSSRVKVRRSALGVSETKEVGQKLQFTVNSLGWKGLDESMVMDVAVAGKDGFCWEDSVRDSRLGFVHHNDVKEAYVDRYTEPHPEHSTQPQLLLNQKHIRPRPNSAAALYNSHLSQKLKEASLPVREGMAGSESGNVSNGLIRQVSFKNDFDTESQRTSTSHSCYNHEVPERDWNITSKGRSCVVDVPPVDSIMKKETEMIAFRDKGQELQKEKENVHRQFAFGENCTSSSPPEHDYPSAESSTKCIQTNVGLSGKPPRLKARPHSADFTKSSAEIRNSLHGNPTAKSSSDIGHWTQLLSQKRSRQETMCVTSSPLTVQSNISSELEDCISPRCRLLQGVVHQLKHQDHLIVPVETSIRQTRDVVENGAGEENLPDNEVANILQRPRAKKKLIIKRGSVKVVHQTDDSNLHTLHTNTRQRSTSEFKERTKSKHLLHMQSPGDGVDRTAPEITKDDHILTLDKLKSLLRGRKSDSRPSSQTSTASVSSPAPLKAVHPDWYSHKLSDSGSQKNRQNVPPTEPQSSKPALRKIIRRPQTDGKSAEDGHRTMAKSSQQTDNTAANSRMLLSSEIQRKNTSDSLAVQRSSSASLVSKLSSSSSVNYSAKSVDTESVKQGTEKNKKVSKTGKKEEKGIPVSRRSKSATDFTKLNGQTEHMAGMSAQSLRHSVKLLHHEVSLRVNEDAYIVQGILNNTDNAEEDNTKDVHGEDPRRACKPLSSDEDTKKAAVSSPRVRSRTSAALGKKYGVAKVDTGSLNGHDGSSSQVAELIQRGRISPVSNISSEYTIRKHSENVHQNSDSDDDDTKDNDENSFVRNMQQSKDMVTSTPKRGSSGQHPGSPLWSGSRRNSHYLMAMGGQIDQDLFPEREITNLRQRRPASVGAIPIPSTTQLWPSEVPTGSAAADLIVSQLGNAGMVHLLQQLYSADDVTRHHLILKAQYFKRWHNGALCLRNQRQVYAQSLKRAHKFIVGRLQRRCFHHWRMAAEENRKIRMADSIHRHHMLKKGLQGFSWAITKSQHQTRTLRTKVSFIITKAAFSKWQAQFSHQRQKRFRSALTRWQVFAYEEKSVREMQRQQNDKLTYQTMVIWKEAYSRRIKENVADNYLRHTSLLQRWRCWCVFTNSSKQKAHRHSQALGLRKKNMLRCTMAAWTLALTQCQRASQYFRLRRLHHTLQAWRQGTQVSRVERQRDMASSLEHWRQTTTRHTFIRWHQQLHQSRALNMANHTLSRKTFNLWRQEWQRHMQRRREIEEAITRSRLHKCLLTWRRNIVDRRRKQRQAVYLLETCLTHVTLLSWSSYTAYKTAFRASLQQHVWMIQRTTLTRCFHTWTNQLHVRLDERHQRELWSLSCVRKMTSRWLHKCHVRSLDNILQQTEPVRELVLLKRCFGDWLAAKGRAEEENMEVVAYQHLLQRCALQRQFQTWRLATQRCLTIRPLVHRQHRRLVTWCFDAWHQHVNNRTQVYNRGKQFQKCQLSRAFTRWRRQFHCQQVSRLAQHSLMQRLALCLLAQWRAILFRKHQAHRYHSQHLLQRTFHLWHRRAHRQLTDKAAQRAEQELSQDLKQGHFSRWWSGVQAQLMEDSDTVASLQQRSNHNHLRSSFSAWRRSLHAHLISRAYQQSVMLRMQRSVLLEWHNTASQLLCSAVQHFAQQIGLQQAATAGEEQEVPCEFGNSLGFEDLQNFENISQSNSPCSSSAASLKCLFASDQLMSSDRMLWGEMDLDRAVLLNSGLCETIEERRQKNRCLQELSILFVSRLRHWPISLVFDQWQEYTVRQRHLQQLAQQVDDKHRALIVSMAFQRWCVHWQHNQKAMDMRNWKLRHGSLMALLNYTGHRKMKARLAQKARGHLVKEVLAKIFPWWLKKAQEQRHQRTILHLWTTATPEEAKLLPLEASLSQKIRLRSLGTCLQAWRIRFLFLTKLKMVYHQQLLHRVFTTWQIWASVRQQEKRKGDHFLQARRKNLAFKSWRERQHQKQETERRYQTAVESYLRQVLWGWREWACLSKQHRHSRQVLEQHINTGRVQSHFRTWLHLTQHAQTIRTKHHTHLMSRLLQSWRQATKEGKRLRQTILSFQAASLAHVVAHLFHRWQLHYKQRLQLHQQREEWAQRSALHCSTVWRRKAQDTRGRKLIVVFKYNLLSRMFIRWQASLIRVEKLKVQQEQLMADRNREVMRGMLVEWRQRLQSRLVARQFTHRLLVTLLHTWTVYTKASKERRIRGLALQHALEERNLRLYFVYWHQMSVRVRSLQNNVEVRLQLRVLQAWSYAVRRRCSQRRTGEKFDRLRQHCIMAQAFATIRCRFDYCQGLKEIADSMCSRRDKRIALLALDRWKDAVDNVLAQRFFHRLVCVRTARQWLRFVVRAKAERRLQQEHHARAVSHHNKKICCRVIEVLKQEVTVRQQLQKRKQRQAKNFALRWKHLTDMAVTAVIVEEERLYAKFWHCWRLAWVSQQASNRDMALYRRQILSQVFTAWCSICPSRSQPSTSHLHHRTKVKAESGRDSPTTTRSFLPVPVGSGARR